MFTLKSPTVFAFVILCPTFFIHAQQGIIVAGGNLNSSSGAVTFSLGQTSDRTTSSSNYILIEGNQQPYEIFTLSTSELTQKLDAKIFPNPVSDVLTINFSNLKKEEFNFELFDLNGKLLFVEKSFDENLTIEMKNRIPGAYFLKINQRNQTINSYKIIKN